MVDRYTKAVLTVIAIALVVIAVQNMVHSSAAQLSNAGIQKVQICDPTDCASVTPHTIFFRGQTIKTYGLLVVPSH